MNIQNNVAAAISYLDACKSSRMNAHHGSITVLCGPPYVGKTARLNSIATSHFFAKRVVQHFTYGESKSSNSKSSAQPADRPVRLRRPVKVLDCDKIHSLVLPETDTVCIDNASQLDGHLLTLCRDLADQQHIDVYVAGRDMFPKGVPLRFGELLCDAERVEKLLLPCVSCRAPTHLWKIVNDPHKTNDVEAVCRRCSNYVDVLPFERRAATLTIITGPPYAGKSDEYCRVIKNKLAEKRSVQVFYSLNGRSPSKIEASTGDTVTPRVVDTLARILNTVKSNVDDIFIDSLHEFPDITPTNIQRLETFLKGGTNVFITTRATDTQGNPVVGIPQLLCMADILTVMLGVCDTCRQENATRTIPSADNPNDRFVIARPGQSLKARCRHHSDFYKVTK